MQASKEIFCRKMRLLTTIYNALMTPLCTRMSVGSIIQTEAYSAAVSCRRRCRTARRVNTTV